MFSSHSFWTSSSLDVPAGVTQEEGHTGFLVHLLSAVRALIFLARRIQSFLSLVDREAEFCVQQFDRSPPVGHFYLYTKIRRDGVSLCFCLFVADDSQRGKLRISPTATLSSCLWSRRIFPSLPGSRLVIFYRDTSSALLQLVNQYNNGRILLPHVLLAHSATEY